MLNLLFRAIVLAFAPHIPEALGKELRFHPRFPDFNGENVGSAIPVLALNRAEQILRDLHPEEVLDPGNARMLQEELADPADIGRGHLVNEIGSDGSSPLLRKQISSRFSIPSFQKGVEDRIEPNHREDTDDQEKIKPFHDMGRNEGTAS